jgi:hypothetical protein
MFCDAQPMSSAVICFPLPNRECRQSRAPPRVPHRQVIFGEEVQVGKDIVVERLEPQLLRAKAERQALFRWGTSCAGAPGLR